MKRKYASVSDEMATKIEERARQRGATESAIIGEALDFYFNRAEEIRKIVESVAMEQIASQNEAIGKVVEKEADKIINNR